jgi:uncharacterized protein YqjF (DUF2071 family)
MSVKRTGSAVQYKSIRYSASGNASTEIDVLPGEAIEAGNFDNFLTARYRLYTLWAGQIAFAQIEHEPWPLQSGRVKSMEQTLLQKVGVPRPVGEPVVHFSENLDVRIERLRLER